MRRLTSILIITGAVLAAAQAAVADLASVPINVISQTLRVNGPGGGDTGDVVGGSSVGTSWNFGSSVQGSSVGTVSSVLTDGELIITIDGVLSDEIGSSGLVSLTMELTFSFEVVVPNLGESTTPLYFQVSRTNSEYTGFAEQNGFNSAYSQAGGFSSYTSQLLGSLVAVSPTAGQISQEDTLITHGEFDLIPTDTATLAWRLNHSTKISVEGSSGTFSQTHIFRALTPIPLPEPSASLTIPSGVGMLFALAKMRGVSLIH